MSLQSWLLLLPPGAVLRNEEHTLSKADKTVLSTQECSVRVPNCHRARFTGAAPHCHATRAWVMAGTKQTFVLCAERLPISISCHVHAYTREERSPADNTFLRRRKHE